MLLIGQYCCPNWWPERAPDVPGKDARGPAAAGEGASDGGIKQPIAGPRHEGCLPHERNARGRKTFLDSAGDHEGSGVRNFVPTLATAPSKGPSRSAEE